MLTKSKRLSKEDLVLILIKFKEQHGKYPSKADFESKKIQPSLRTFQRKFGTVGEAFSEADKYKSVDAFEQMIEEEEKKREIKAYKRKFRKRPTIDSESLQEEEITNQKGRKKNSAGNQIGFQCSFCGNFITGATDHYSSMTKIIASRLINLALSSNGQTYCDGVLDSLFKIFGSENRAVRRDLEVAGLLERFEQRDIFTADIENE